MSARARIRRRWRAFIRPGSGRAFSSQSLLQLCQQTLPTRHSPRVRPSAGHHAERNRFQISRLNTLAVFASPLLLAPAGKGWPGTHRSWLTSSSPCEALHTQHSQRSAPPSTSRLRTGRPALCERGGVEIEPQAAHEITYMLQAAAATTSSRRGGMLGAAGFARGGVTHIAPPTAWQMWAFLVWPQMPHLYFERPVLFFSAAVDIFQQRPSPKLLEGVLVGPIAFVQ